MRLFKNMIIGEILVKTLTCLLISTLFLACWRGMIHLIYLFIYIYIYIYIHIYIHVYIYIYIEYYFK